jgi:dipeptidyl aminopeptidase/acylaminoacyl peptidase
MLYGYSMVEQSPLPVLFVHSKAGPADFSTFALDSDDAKQFMEKSGLGVMSPEELAKNEQFLAMLRAISPVTYVQEGTPTTLLSYGRQDTLVVWENVNSLMNAFAATGVEYTLVEYPNSGHGLDKDPDSVARTAEAMAESLRAAFGY